MLTMDKKKSIRESFFVNGKNISEIGRETGHTRKTIRKYLKLDDWNEPMPVAMERKSKLDPFKAVIDGWLRDDRRFKRKRRHTAKRIFNRLSTEDGTRGAFDCSYVTVNNYVKKRKSEIFGARLEGSIPLEHKPGEAQADFGAADYYENGALHEGRHFNVSFPYSNQGFMQLFPGENTECLLEGLTNIFRHIGGVPSEIRFDNASTMVAYIMKGGERKLTERFMRFAEHYGFTAIFCNPDAGREKGSVEGKVGCHRRNMLVPVPEFREPSEFNRHLLELADSDALRPHYKKERSISGLFEDDRSAFPPLPKNEFDTAGYDVAKVDNYGFIKLNKGRHEYSTAPKHAGGSVTVRLTSATVVIIDGAGNRIASHKRLYGDGNGRQMNWTPYLEQLARRPRAVKYSGIYGILPQVINEYLDKCKGRDISDLIGMIAEPTRKAGFESALTAVSKAVSLNALDGDSLMALHRRLFMDAPELPPLDTPRFPVLDPLTPDLTRYNPVMQGGDRL